MKLKRKYGWFCIPIDLFTNDNISKIQNIMSKCIILRAELMFARRAIEYEAYSEDFEEVPEMQIMNDYEVDIETGKFTRINYDKKYSRRIVK